MDQHSNSSPWTSLPKELLSSIATRLDSRVDVLRLRAVCTLWRSSLPRPLSHRYSSVPHFPRKIPFPFVSTNNLKPNSFFSFNEVTIYALQPLTKISNSWNTTKSWFIAVQKNPYRDSPEEGPKQMHLKDPLPNFLVDELPKSFPNVINLLDYRVSEIAKFFDLTFVDGGESEVTCVGAIYKSMSLQRLAASSSDFSDVGFTAAAITPCGQLGVWKKGQDKWTLINDPLAEYYHDIVCYKDKFYVLDYMGRVKVVDFSFNVTHIASPVPCDSVCDYPYQHKHLVESCGDLLVVDVYVDAEQGFDESDTDYPVRLKVYKLNGEGSGWVPVTNLGDQALFLGCMCSFSVSARDFPGCKGNCIYFLDKIFKRNDGEYPGKDVGIYDLDDGSVGSLSCFMGYSKIFWPPPTWLKLNSPHASGRSM